MRVKIYQSYGFAGTDTEYFENIPQEIIEQGEEAIAEYVETLTQDLWGSMTERLEVSVTVVE